MPGSGGVTAHVVGGWLRPVVGAPAWNSCTLSGGCVLGAWLPCVSTPGGLRPKLRLSPPLPSGLWGPEEAPGIFSVWPETAKGLSWLIPGDRLGARVSLWVSLPREPSDPFPIISPSPSHLWALVSLYRHFFPSPSLSHSLFSHTLRSPVPLLASLCLPDRAAPPPPASGAAPGPQPEGHTGMQVLSSWFS